jgi:hypothetical protein
MSAEVHVGDVGTEFRVQVNQEGAEVDLLLATVKQLKFRKPDGTVLAKTAVAGTVDDPAKTAALGWMYYLSAVGDLDLGGGWIQQGYVEIGTGKWHTDEFEFTVYPALS